MYLLCSRCRRLCSPSAFAFLLLQTADLEHYTAYTPAELWSCLLALVKVHQGCAANNLHAVRDKYRTTSHFSVSSLHQPMQDAAVDAIRLVLGVPEVAPSAAAAASHDSTIEV